MKRDEELTVITKTYDLILWTCNHVSRFPRNHRFGLGERIERIVYVRLSRRTGQAGKPDVLLRGGRRPSTRFAGGR